MLTKLKLLDYILLFLLLLKGLLGKRYYRTEDDFDTSYLGDIESDYFKIFSDIKDMRSKIPNHYSADVTFEPERAYYLLKDPTNSKRTSIITPWEDADSALQNITDPSDRILSRGDSFQKRKDDPWHQAHGVGVGLAALPKPTKEYEHAEEAATSSIIKLENSYHNAESKEDKNNFEKKTADSRSLGMVRDDANLGMLHITPKMDTEQITRDVSKKGSVQKNEETLDKSYSENKGKKILHVSPIIIEGKTKIEKIRNKNDTESGENVSKDIAGNLQKKDKPTITKASELGTKKTFTDGASKTYLATSKYNALPRNMIFDSQIKGFLAKMDNFTFADVGQKRTTPFSLNESFPEKIASNFESRLLSALNITAENPMNSSYTGVQISGETSTTNRNSSVSIPRNKTLNISNSTHEGHISPKLGNETFSKSNYSTPKSISLKSEVNNPGKAKSSHEVISDKGGKMVDVETGIGMSYIRKDVVNYSPKKELTKAELQTHKPTSIPVLHLASVIDEMKPHVEPATFNVPATSKKKDSIDAVFQPECSPNKKCPGGKYCRHFECYDCHNKHHECIADEQCCDEMPCIYGRCDKKPKSSPGAICKNDGDCSDGCCVLEPTINIETGICKIKLAEFHQCSPVLFRKVWIGDKKPACGPCEDGLDCVNKGIIATHLVCMKKKK